MAKDGKEHRGPFQRKNEAKKAAQENAREEALHKEMELTKTFEEAQKSAESQTASEVKKAIGSKKSQVTMQAEQDAVNISQTQTKKILRSPVEKLTSFDASRVRGIWKLFMETTAGKKAVKQMAQLQFESQWRLMKLDRGVSRLSSL